MVNSATETETKSVTIGSVLEDIRNGRWKIPVGRIREKYATEFAKAVKEGDPDPAAKAKDAVKQLKQNLPGVCGSGTFTRRDNAGLVEHSGFLVPDIDNFKDAKALEEAKQVLESDRYVQAVFASPTNTGLKAIVRIQPDGAAHRRSFLAVQKYFRHKHGMQIDPQCCDQSRLCFVSHDPELFMRKEEAAILEPLPPEKEASGPPAESTVEYTDDDAGNAALLMDLGMICASFTNSAHGSF
jgi:hypothetical protein